MAEKDDFRSWIGFIAGLLTGLTLGGLFIYLFLLRNTQTMLKTFAYDDAGRLIQVMKENGV